MTDSDLRTDVQSSSQDLGNKLEQAGEEVKQRASDAFNATSDVAREKVDELGATARETAAHAADKVKQQVSAQQEAGADYAHRFAGNIRSAAKAFEHDAPIAARTIEKAAEYIEDAAEKMRTGSMRDMVDGMTSFARRQPAAFLGLSILAGFAAVRFLKASGGGTSSARTQTHAGMQSTGARRE